MGGRVDTLLQIGLGNALMATILAVGVAGISGICRRPALVHALWLLVLVKLVTPAPLMLPVSMPAWLDVRSLAPPSEPEQGAEAVANSEASAPASAWRLATAMGAYFERYWAQIVLTVWLSGAGL